MLSRFVDDDTYNCEQIAMMTLMLDVMIAAAVVLVSVGTVALIVTKWLLARLKAKHQSSH